MHVSRAFWILEFDGDSHFTFDPWSGQQNKTFHSKTCLPCAVCLMIPKMSFVLCTTYRNANKMNSGRATPSMLSTSLPIARQKNNNNKDIALKFGMLVGRYQLRRTYSVSVDGFKFDILLVFIHQNNNLHLGV